jgi:hypothetical protein
MVLSVRPSLPLAARDSTQVLDEGARLLGFIAPDREHDVGFVGP